MLKDLSKSSKGLFKNLKSNNLSIKIIIAILLLIVAGCATYFCKTEDKKEDNAPAQIVIKIDLPEQGQTYYAVINADKKTDFVLNTD